MNGLRQKHRLHDAFLDFASIFQDVPHYKCSKQHLRAYVNFAGNVVRGDYDNLTYHPQAQDFGPMDTGDDPDGEYKEEPEEDDEIKEEKDDEE